MAQVLCSNIGWIRDDNIHRMCWQIPLMQKKIPLNYLCVAVDVTQPRTCLFDRCGINVVTDELKNSQVASIFQ